MTKILINYSNWRYALARPYNSLTGRMIGGVDRIIEYSPRDLSRDFRRRNRKLLRCIDGGGYWIWKPWIILETLRNMSEDDILLYSDAGAIFLHSIDPLLERMEETGQDVMAFSREGAGLEKHWTKRDVFQLLNCDSPEYTDTTQVRADFHLWKKTEFSMDLAREWLHYVQDEKLVRDSRSRCGLPNYPGFQANLHDQSIFSLLLKKRRLLIHLDPSRRSADKEGDFPDDRYPRIIFINKYGTKLRPLQRDVVLPSYIALVRYPQHFYLAIHWRIRKLRRLIWRRLRAH